MVSHAAEAGELIACRDGDLLEGIVRSLTDFCTICCPADLAVRESHQRQGIGVELIRRTQAAFSPNEALDLNAALEALPLSPSPATFPTLELLRPIPQYVTLSD